MVYQSIILTIFVSVNRLPSPGATADNSQADDHCLTLNRSCSKANCFGKSLNILTLVFPLQMELFETLST